MDKIKLQNEFSNYNAWLNGLYVFDAVSKCLYNSLGRKETQSAVNYVEKPYDFNAKPKSKEQIAKEERLKVEEQIRERNKQIKEMLKKKEK